MIARDDVPLLTDTQTFHGSREVDKNRDSERTSVKSKISNDYDQGNEFRDENTKKIWKDTNARQKSILMYIATVNFVSYLCTSTASPFLARVILERGSTIVFSTIILQIPMITMAISSVIFGKYQSRIGCKRLVVFGQIAFAITELSFGSIGYFDDKWSVVIAGASLRALSGVFQAAFNVAGLSIVCEEFPEFISIVFGICQAANGAGSFVGPYLGGFLYDWSGDTMVPMAVAGTAALLSSALGFVTLKPSQIRIGHVDSDNSHILRVVTEPRAILVIGAAVSVTGSMFVVDATVTVYLEAKGFSTTRVGQFLFVIGVTYAFGALIAGFITNRRRCLRRLVFSSGLVGSCAFSLTFTPGQTDLKIFLLAVGYSMSCTFAYIPAFDELMHVITGNESSADVNESMRNAVTGLWYAAVSLSNFVLPLIGSAMETALPFYISLSASLLIGYATALIVAMLMFFCRAHIGVTPLTT